MVVQQRRRVQVTCRKGGVFTHSGVVFEVVGEVAGEGEAEVVADLVTQLSIGTIVVGA